MALTCPFCAYCGLPSLHFALCFRALFCYKLSPRSWNAGISAEVATTCAWLAAGTSKIPSSTEIAAEITTEITTKIIAATSAVRRLEDCCLYVILHARRYRNTSTGVLFFHAERYGALKVGGYLVGELEHVRLDECHIGLG